MREHTQLYDLKFIKGFIRRRKTLFLIVASVIFISSVLYSLLTPRYYVSSATILIEGQTTDEVLKGAASISIEERLQSITQQLLTRDKLIEIINQFGMYDNPKDPEAIEAAIKRMREYIILRTIKAEDLDKRPTRRGYNTIAFTLSFQGKDPIVVQKVASRLAALFIEKEAQTKERMVSQTTNILQQRVNQLKERTDILGAKLSDFKTRHAGELPEALPFNLEQIYRLNTQLDEVNGKIKILENRGPGNEGQLTSLNQQNPLTGNPSSTDPSIRLEQLRLQLVNLQARYSDKHPDVIKTKAEIKRLESSLGTSSEKTSNTSRESELNRYIKQRDELQAKINGIQNKNRMAPLIQSEHSKLTADYDSATKQLNDAMSKLAEAKAAQGVEENQMGERFTIIEEPVVPQAPEKSLKSRIILSGFLLSIIGGLLAAFVSENIDHSIKSPEQLQTMTKLPVLSVVPIIRSAKDSAASTKKYGGIKIFEEVRDKIFRMIKQSNG